MASSSSLFTVLKFINVFFIDNMTLLGGGHYHCIKEQGNGGPRMALLRSGQARESKGRQPGFRTSLALPVSVHGLG